MKEKQIDKFHLLATVLLHSGCETKVILTDKVSNNSDNNHCSTSWSITSALSKKTGFNISRFSKHTQECADEIPCSSATLCWLFAVTAARQPDDKTMMFQLCLHLRLNRYRRLNMWMRLIILQFKIFNAKSKDIFYRRVYFHRW